MDKDNTPSDSEEHNETLQLYGEYSDDSATPVKTPTLQTTKTQGGTMVLGIDTPKTNGTSAVVPAPSKGQVPNMDTNSNTNGNGSSTPSATPTGSTRYTISTRVQQEIHNLLDAEDS